MIRILFFVVIVFCGVSSIFSQNIIRGNVQDQNSEGIPYATVALFNSVDTSLVKTAASDLEGNFELLSIKSGNYFIKLSFVGYRPKEVDNIIFSGEQEYDLGTITMEQTVENLQEIEVSAVRPLVEIKPDKTVFNVEGTINASGSDGLELLRKAPGVTLDNNDNISLRGKSGVVIYIDNKPSMLSAEDLAAYLQSLSANQIDNIEIISNPSAKYDAQGNAGIINIILKKQQKQNANANINLGYKQGFYPKYDASLTANYRRKFLNVFLNYGYNQFTFRNFHSFYREQNSSVFDMSSVSVSEGYGHNAKLGVDFNVSDFHTVGFILSGSARPNGSSTTSANTLLGPLSTGFEQELEALTDGSSDGGNMNYNVNYRFKDTTGHSLTIDVDYGNYQNRRVRDQSNYYYKLNTTDVTNSVLYIIDTQQDIELTSGKMDYEQYLWKGALGMGVKYSKATTNNDFRFYDVINQDTIINTNRTNNFTYTEDVIAAYVSYAKDLSDKWSFQTGLRMENTTSLGELEDLQGGFSDEDVVQRYYTNFFPNLGLSYKLNKDNTFGMNVSKRINRPNYHQLNPFEYKLDELNYNKGNPFLQPEYSYIAEVNHNYKGVINTSLSYTYIDQFFGEVLLPTDSNPTYQTTVNLASQENINLSGSASIPVKKWWFLYISFWGNYLNNQADFGNGNIIDLQAVYGGMYGQSTFTLPKEIKMEVSGWYGTGGIWQGNMESRPMGALHLGFQKKILANRGTVKLAFNDILYTQKWGIETRIGGMYERGSGGWESQQVRLNFSYIIGNEKLRNAKRQTALEEESKRIGGGE